MLDHEFDAEIKKLEAHVGRKLGPEQKESWFNKLSYLSANSFRNAIDRITDRKNTFPTLEEIRETAKEFKGIAEPIRVVGCEDCRGTGWIQANNRLNDSEQTYAFRCTCLNSRGLSETIPLWSYNWESEYKRL